MHYDTVICGAGLAGLTAALVSLNRGKSTAVVARGESSLYYISGYLDLCGNTDDPWNAIVDLVYADSGHPYAFTGASEKSEALEFFVEQTQDGYPYAIPANMRNRFVPTCSGRLRRTYLVPEGAGVDRIADPAARVLAVGFSDYRDYCAQLMVDGLNSRGYHWKAAEIESGCSRINQTSIDLASYLDTAYPVLLEKLSGVVKDCDCLAFPAVLGLKKHRVIAGKISETFGVPVFEVPTFPPSIPGMRLSAALIARMRSLGGDLFTGFPATSAVSAGGRCTGLMVATPGRTRLIEGDSYIVATGGIVGEGTIVERDGMREMVFGLPVITGGATDERFLFREQGYARSGIRIGSDMRPIGEDGKVIYENVFCAGRALAGYEPFTEHDGAGVAIVTGYQAARAATRRWD
jgi:glycerol-3-phosphate dehydrogenase subunit B